MREPPGAVAICCLLAVLGAGILLGLEYVARPWIVVGESMLPALEPGDRVLVDVWTYRQRAPRLDEVVLFRPSAGSPVVVKRVARVVALPLGGESLWLLGDNARNSLDSRTLGPVERDRIIGRVVIRIWPPRLHEFP